MEWLRMLAESHDICYSPKTLDLYKRPRYLIRAAKAKYGDDIFVLGATQYELDNFWYNTVSYRAINVKGTKEKGRTIIDIDTKSHSNTREEDGNVNAPDRTDEFEITSTKGSSQLKTKTYQLQFGKTYTFQVGGSLELKPQFFNIAGGGVGISGSRSTQTTEQVTSGETKNETLSQEYQLVERLVVPPKTKVTATIETYAVTYEGETETKVSAPKNSSIPVRYRTMLSRQWTGGIVITTGYITAKELFRGQATFQEEEEMVYFVEETKVSYLGEDVQIVKEKKKVD